MAGIYGIWKFQHNESIGAIARVLRDTVDQGFGHPFHQIEGAGGSAIFGSAMPPLYSSTIWPMETSDQNVVMLVQGEIFLPNGTVLNSQNWQSEFLQHFIADPSTALLKLDGAFILAVFDKRANRLYLASDRFGNFAVHYRRTLADFAFATQMSALASIGPKKDLDPSGMAQYLGLGYTLNGLTQFAGISRLPAASLLSVSEHAFKIEEYYLPSYHAITVTNRTGDRIIEEFSDIFSQSVKLRAHRSDEDAHPVAAALSGGFDSRLTWAAIASVGKSKTVNAFTLGLPDSRDVDLSSKIAARIGIRHLRHIFDTEFLKHTPDCWQSTLNLTEGSLGIESTTTVQTWHKQQHEYKILLDSFGGALYRRQFMRLKGRSFSIPSSYAERMFDLTHTPLATSNILHPDLRAFVREQSIDGLHQFFERYTSIGSIGDQLDFFYTTQISTNRNALSNNAQLNFLGLHYPLYTSSGYELVQQVPESLRRRNWIHSEVIRMLAPELTKFPIDNQGMWGPYLGFSYLRYLGMGYEFFLSKAKYVLGDRLTRTLSFRRPLTDQELIIRLNIKRFEEEILGVLDICEDYFDRQSIEKALSAFKHHANNHLAALQQVLSFGLWLETIKSKSR